MTCDFYPPGVTNGRPKAKKKLFLKENSSHDCSTPTSIGSSSELRDVAASMTKLSCTPPEKTSPRGWGRGRGRGGWNRGKVQKKMIDLMGGLGADMSPDFVPYKKRTFTTKINHKVAQQSSVYTQPDQKLRGTERHKCYTNQQRSREMEQVANVTNHLVASSMFYSSFSIPGLI